MNLKKFTHLTFILGLSILCVYMILPVALLLFNNGGTSVGIIGTAEGLNSKITFFFTMLSLIYRTYHILGIVLGVILLVISALCKFCKNTIEKYMNVKTTLCALIFSFANGLTLCSLYNLFVIVIADLPNNYPKFASAIYIFSAHFLSQA